MTDRISPILLELSLLTTVIQNGQQLRILSVFFLIAHFRLNGSLILWPIKFAGSYGTKTSAIDLDQQANRGTSCISLFK
jgi:hypothetical protein